MPHLLVTLTVAFGMMTLLWLPSLWLRDVSIIDVLWAPAFVILAGVCASRDPGIGPRGWVALALVCIWAARLGTHILARWKRFGREDYRYAAMRSSRGPHFPLTSLATIFWLQAFLLWIISWPLQAVFVAREAPLQIFDAVAAAMICAGIAIEAIADRQLTRFRADPASKGQVLQTWLWAWSRHPNYFGDFLLWWGFYVLALSAGGPWWTIAGPITMSALLIHYSGAGLMEDTIGNRRPSYADYVLRTSGFIPLPPLSTQQPHLTGRS